MPTQWMDMSQVPFQALLLLERVQLSWFPGWVPEPELAVALQANPIVEWYLRHKCPELGPWLDKVMAQVPGGTEAENVREAERAVLRSLDDLLVYVLSPEIYDAQIFLAWDSHELLSLADFSGKVVLDIGAGTGRLAFAVSALASAVYAVEPVANLRYYLQHKAAQLGICNLYPIDGLITKIPFENAFADITMGGHVFGDAPEEELTELLRVTKRGGSVILCPANNDCDTDRHRFLVDNGFSWACFEEPGAGMMRKYWKQLS